jgi:hypothetical protein
LDKREISYLNGLWLTWGEFEQAERSVIGLFPATWPETSHPSTRTALRSHRSGVKRQKRYIPLPQPHSTRERPSSRPLLHDLDNTSPKIRSIAISQPLDVKRVIICLWLQRYPWDRISKLLDVSSREIGQIKYGLLETTQDIVV